MARIRTIKPEFWTDEKLAPLSPLTRLTFLGLVSMADDAGRLNDSVKLLDGLLFSETNDSCESPLDELAELGLISRGKSSGGKKIIQIIGWLKHQKIEKANLKAALPEISTTDRGSVDDSSRRRSKMSDAMRLAILEHDEYKCCKCGVQVDPNKQDRYDARPNLAEIDHIIPLADGGADEPENMQTLCKKCNREKQGRDLYERNRRGVDDPSPKAPRKIDDISPPRPTTNDQRSTTNDQGPRSREEDAAASEADAPPPSVLIKEFLLAWNTTMGQKCESTEKRKLAFRSRIRSPVWADCWRTALAKIPSSPFCMGDNDRGWVADIDWFLRPDTVQKILEGKYDDKVSAKRQPAMAGTARRTNLD